MSKQISDLKIGDVVVIGNRRKPMTTETVTKITKTQIITDSGKRFSIRSGDVIGGSSFSTQHWLQRDHNMYGFLMSVESMQRENEQNANAQEIRNLASKISNNSSKLNSMSLADLKKIATLMGLE